jgi:hypothetical protein
LSLKWQILAEEGFLDFRESILKVKKTECFLITLS